MGALAVLLWLFAGASSVLAGPPNHPRSSALDISGFNHACGTVVDSEGNVYVASAGESKIRIFGPEHNELTPSISNPNEPCGLAVDSKGNLYVSENATGKVVKYHPATYPFSGPPSYEPVVTIDNSGEAKGISVDPTDDRLYVAEGNHISVYDFEGKLGIDEVQRVLCFEAIGGNYRLSFAGQKTEPIPCEASHTEVQVALEALSTIGAGNVSVENDGKEHFVSFVGKFAHTDMEQLVSDPSELLPAPGAEDPRIVIQEKKKGFSGHIGEGGDLTAATGVAAYTYKISGEQSDRYVFAADAATDEVKFFGGPNLTSLKLRRTIKGPKEGEDFGFGSSGAYLVVDAGNRNAEDKCSSIAEQACTTGHLLVYDDAHAAVDEFDASGEFLDQFTDPGFADAKPTGLAIDRSGGSGDGTIYVTAGAGAGAKLLAFAPLAIPSRPPLPELSHALEGTEAVATDFAGDVYAASGKTVHVYGPDGDEIKVGLAGKGFEIEEPTVDLAVDSAGNVYTLENVNNGNRATENVQYYAPNSYPPHDGTQYIGPVEIADGNSFLNSGSPPSGIGINPVNDHIFFTNASQTIELDAAAKGSAILDPCFACDFGTGTLLDIAAYGINGNVYIAKNFGTVEIIDPSETEILAQISGAGSPKGPFVGPPGVIAVDQSNGHLFVFDPSRGAAEEYDAAGGFVAEFGEFTSSSFGRGIAIDNSGSPGDGNVYIAFDDPAPGTFDLTAFGPLAYGEAPVAVTGVADGLGAGNATLNGSVDPRGFELEDCHFEYLSDAQYQENIASEDPAFKGALSTLCAESLAGIGKGTGPVPVHADLGSLDLGARYRFRLLAQNKYGPGEGKAGLFGPPVLKAKSALPIFYDEATLRAEVDPSGLATKYRFEYGTSEAYGQSTPIAELAPGDGPVMIETPLTGLGEGTEYHFRIVVENEAKAVEGPDQVLVTLSRQPAEGCPNTEFRTGLSANLPDCRAYELVTPAETRGQVPGATISGSTGEEFNNWLVTPRGAGAGESLAFFTVTLPGFDGSGDIEGYHAQRGEGPHPAEGWTSEIVSPTYAQVGLDGGPRQHGVASDQRYWFYGVGGASEAFEETLPEGQYLRTPGGVADSKCNPVPSQDHFELVGCGSLGTDPDAAGRYVSAGGSHVIFFSDVLLEEEAGNEAAPEGTVAIYDRAAGSSSAEVVSVKPDGSAFGADEDATYLATTEDGSAIVFEVDGTLYLHREGQTTEVAAPPNVFAGVSEDGERVFYAAGASGKVPAALFACDLQAGPCAGPEAHAATEVAASSIFLNVSDDGSHVFFTSEEAITGAEENEAGQGAEAGEHNLYAWDGASTRLLAILDPQDFEGFGGDISVNMLRWTSAITAGVGIGRSLAPTRSTPDGKVFVFQSHAQLTAYDNEGKGEIYRYEAEAAPGEQLSCVSCDPTGAPPTATQRLVLPGGAGVIQFSTLVPNVTDNGQNVFFQSPDRLLPEDTNDVEDVYEWKVPGAGSCKRAGGCLALISSGQGEEPSYLFGMSADGRDVFFETPEKLVGLDVPGSPSLYDARVEGGIPDPPVEEDCQGDACQPLGSGPPTLPAPASTAGPGNGNVQDGKVRPCSKGKRKVRIKGKARCVKKPGKRARHNNRKHRASRNRRTQR